MPLKLEHPVIWTNPEDNPVDSPSTRLGRLCRINNQTGFCCVRFVGIGCRRVLKSRLTPSDDESAPSCTDSCREGC
jgi:hypothetical protein